MISFFAVAVVGAGFGLWVPAHAQRQSFTDAGAYCRAVRSIDAPDRRYKGPAAPRWMKRALGADGQYDEVMWRCERGAVLACAGGGTMCTKRRLGRVPSSLIREYCRANPGARDISPAYIGGYEIYDWACRGTAPYIVRQVVFPDARGFVPDEWRQVSAPAQRR